MIFTTAPGYLASRDTLNFHRRQTAAQQQQALGNKSLPQLYQLRAAIQNRGEKIPGRTAEESLAMVDHVIQWCHDYDRYRRREEARKSWLMLGYLVAVCAAVVVTLYMPAILDGFLGVTR